MKNALDIYNNWQKILSDLAEEIWDNELYKETLSCSMEIIKEQEKKESVSKPVVAIIMKMARFAEREVFCPEQDIAHDEVYDILWDLEDEYLMHGIDN